MTDTREQFEKWVNSTVFTAEFRTNQEWMYLAYQASAQVAQGRINELHTRLNEVATAWQVIQLKLTALEARNRELESALKRAKHILGLVEHYQCCNKTVGGGCTCGLDKCRKLVAIVGGE